MCVPMRIDLFNNNTGAMTGTIELGAMMHMSRFWSLNQIELLLGTL